VAGLQGLQGLQGLKALVGQTVYQIPEENILSRSGQPADPRHGQDQSGNPPYLTGPYPNDGTQGAYGPSGIEDDGFMSDWSLGKGSEDPDQSPMSHAAPFPSPGYGQVRDTEAEWRMQREGMNAHAADFGMADIVVENPNSLDYENATFNQRYAESQGTTVTEGMQIPGTILTGAGGGRDREVLGNGGNPHFSVAHIQSRDQIDGIPFNYQWMDASQRPFTVRQVGLKNTFDGPDSPYAAAGDETTGMMLSPDQAAVMSDATAYVAPPDPNVAPVSAGNSDTWAW
jgi:hypothetical protein